MRLSLPERIPVQKAFIVAACIAAVEQYQGTSFAFSLLFFGFIMMSVVSFNLAGGFSRVVGAYIFWFAMLVPGVGVFWKSVLGEAAETNLKAPLLTLSAYTVSMAMLALVAILTNRIDLRNVGLSAKAPNLDYTQAGLGCLVFWFFVTYSQVVVGGALPGLYSAFRQIDIFRPLAVLLSTIGVVKATGGRRSLNVVNVITILSLVWDGMLNASKQGMMTPLVCWVVAATYVRLKLTFSRIVCVIIGCILSFTVFSQISQARDLFPDDASYTDRVGIVVHELTHYDELVAHNQSALSDDVSSFAHHYYDTNQNGLIARLSMISPDDSFFNYASTVPSIGLSSISDDFRGLIPNIMLSTKKEGFGAGNHYAHEIGGYLAPDDDSTGISFSPVPEAYHLAGWSGIIFVLPAIWVLLFLSIDFICGDLRKAPWALMVIVYFGHAAPESLISGLVYYIGYGNFGMVVAIVFCTRLAPILGTLFYGGQNNPSMPVSSVARARLSTEQPRTALP